jgi:hypothetical protein
MSYLKVTTDGSNGSLIIRGDQRGLTALRDAMGEALLRGSFYVEGAGQELLVLKVNDPDG